MKLYVKITLEHTKKKLHCNKIATKCPLDEIYGLLRCEEINDMHI